MKLRPGQAGLAAEYLKLLPALVHLLFGHLEFGPGLVQRLTRDELLVVEILRAHELAAGEFQPGLGRSQFRRHAGAPLRHLQARLLDTGLQHGKHLVLADVIATIHQHRLDHADDRRTDVGLLFGHDQAAERHRGCCADPGRPDPSERHENANQAWNHESLFPMAKRSSHASSRASKRARSRDDRRSPAIW